MPVNYTYLIIDLGSVLVPFLYTFHKKIQFYKEWRALWPAVFISALIFVAWDMLYTELGVWGFNVRYLTGLKIYNLPIEEVLFFICIPYASVFTYYCFEKFDLKFKAITIRWMTLIIFPALIIAGICFYDRLYTSVTFFALALLIGYAWLKKQDELLCKFYFMYLIILIPFFIVNGLLTGTGLEEPVVWYNDAENMGLRLLTIPFEDVFYGMLLLFLNTICFEYLRKRYVRKNYLH